MLSPSTVIQHLLESGSVATPPSPSTAASLRVAAENAATGAVGPDGRLHITIDEFDAVLRTADGQPLVSVASTGDGGVCLRRPNDFLNFLPFGWVPRQGPVAYVGWSAATARRTVEALRVRGVGASTIALVRDVDPLGAGDWVDFAARHPDTRTVIVEAAPLGYDRQLCQVLEAVGRHVPLVFVDPDGAGRGRDPWFSAWLVSTGAPVVENTGHAAMLAAGLAALEPPAGNRLSIVCESETEAERARSIAATQSDNLEADCVVCDATDRAVLDSVVGDLSHDAVIVRFPSSFADPSAAPEFATRVARAGQQHPEQALLLVADNVPALQALAGASAPPGLPIFDSVRAALRSLSAVLAWSERAQQAPISDRYRLADELRLRRALGTGAGRAARQADLKWQGDVLAGLGVPAAPGRIASYVEDAMMCAAELGYPLEVRACLESEWISRPSFGIARNSEELQSVCAQLQAEAQRRSGGRVQLMLRRIPEGAARIRILAMQHEVYGPVAHVKTSAGSTYVIGVVELAPVEGVLARSGIETGVEPLAISVRTATQALLAATARIDALAAVRLDGVVEPGAGYLATGAAIASPAELDK